MALADTVRDRWDSISPRERRLVVLLGVSFVVCGVLWLAFAIRDGLDAIEQRNVRMRKALSALSDLRVRGPKKPADDVVATIGTSPIKLDSYLDAVATKVGIKVPSYSPRTPVVKNGFTATIYAIEVRDLTIEQIKDFLEQVETGNRLVMVTSMTLDRSFREKEKIDMKLEVSTYYKTPDTSGSGSGSDAGSGSGSGSASGGG